MAAWRKDGQQGGCVGNAASSDWGCEGDGQVRVDYPQRNKKLVLLVQNDGLNGTHAVHALTEINNTPC